MYIQLYLYDENENEIFSANELEANPFVVGDVIHLDVIDLAPRDTSGINPEMRANFEKDNDKTKELFHLKRARLLTENKYVKFNILNEPTLVISYKCEIIE